MTTTMVKWDKTIFVPIFKLTLLDKNQSFNEADKSLEKMTIEVDPAKIVTIGEAQTRKQPTRFQIISRQVLASVSLFFVGISQGMAFAFTGTLLPRIRDFVDEENGTWLAATNVFSMVVGSYVNICIVPLLGYRICLINSEIFCFIGWLILSFAANFMMFICGCVLVGFSSGFAYQTTFMSRSEIPESGIRGTISMFISSSYTLGVLLGHLSDILLSWRVALRCCSLAPLLTAIVCAFVYPESSSWLLYQERTEEAKKIFFRLRGVTVESQQEFRFMQEKQSILKERGILGSFRAIRTKDFLVPFFIGSMVLTAQCVSGFDVIVVYSVDLLSQMSSYVSPTAATVLFDIVSFASCMVSCYVVQKMTRRGLLFFSSLGTVVLLLLLMAISMYQLSAAVFIMSLCTYSAILNVGLVPVSWLLLAEIFPESNKDIGIFLTNAYIYFFTFVLTKLIPIIDSGGGIVAALGFFCVTLLLSLIVLFFIVPETKELPLQEIEDVIRQGKLYRFASFLTERTASPKSSIQ